MKEPKECRYCADRGICSNLDRIWCFSGRRKRRVRRTNDAER